MFEEYAQEVSTQTLINELRACTDAANAYADDAVKHLGHLSVAVEEQDSILQTRQAVAEVVNIAWRQNGGEGNVESRVLRHREAA